MKYEAYAQKSIGEIERDFETSIKKGLSTEEVARRRAKFGLHQVKQSALTWIGVLARQFNSPLIWLFVGAAVLSLFLGDRANALIIAIIIGINTLLSFFQEYRAEKTVRLLSAYLVVKARVIRSGVETVIESKEIVPGDIVLIDPGEAVPADIRLVETEGLSIDEAALTGESVPQNKSIAHPDNIAFMGTTVIGGSGIGIVLTTGADTAFGQVSMLTLTTPHESSFHYNITQLAQTLVRMALIMLVVVIGLNILIKGHTVNIAELIGFSIALALSITPEALPVVTTSALTQSAFKLAQKKVIIKRLTSIEDLGSITLLCADKTGTLTENVMTVADVLKNGDNDPLFFAAISEPSSRDGFEAAAYKKLSVADRQRVDAVSVVHESAFDPVRRITAKRVVYQGKKIVTVKGSFDAVLENCSCLDQASRDKYKTWERDQGKNGRRALAVAYVTVDDKNGADIPHELTLAGLIAFEDPIKSTVVDTIKRARHLGVGIKILSGDAPEVTGAVAYRVGLIPSPDQVITGSDLSALPELERARAIDRYDVFARVTPEQKADIVQHLRTHDTIGFIGDGVNDAPALKAAHVGIVVCHATEIARSAADIVLMRKNLGVIVEGIYLGRKTFNNTVEYLKTTLCSSIGNFYSIAVASLFIGFLPMLPMQILLVDLLSDAPMVALSTDNVDPEELRMPARYGIREIVKAGIFFALISSVFDLILFALLRHQPAVLQTMWYIMTLCEQIGFIFIIRTKKSIFKAVRPSAILVSLSVLVLAIGVTLPYTPFGRELFAFMRPSWHNMAIVLGIMSAYFVVTETVKVAYYRARASGR